MEQPPKQIIGYSKFEKAATPYTPAKVVKIYGEEHKYMDNPMGEAVDMAAFLARELDRDPNAKVYLEQSGEWTGGPGVAVATLNRTGDLLSLFGGTRYQNIDRRQKRDTYMPHFPQQLADEFSRYAPNISISERKQLRDFVDKEIVEPIIQRHPSYLQRYKEYEKYGPAFLLKAPILDKDMFEIIHRNDGVNPIFYVGDAHREAVAESLQNDPQREFVGSALKRISRKSLSHI